MLIRSGEAPGVGWSRNMLYSGFNTLHRSVVRRQTGFAARITRTLSRLVFLATLIDMIETGTDGQQLDDTKLAKSGSAACTVACLVVGVAGVLINATCAFFVPNENWLPLFIYLSMAMIVVGYLPHFKPFRWSRIATIAMSAFLLLYFAWIALFAMGSD